MVVRPPMSLHDLGRLSLGRSKGRARWCPRVVCTRQLGREGWNGVTWVATPHLYRELYMVQRRAKPCQEIDSDVKELTCSYAACSTAYRHEQA